MTGPAGRDERTSVLTGLSGWADQLPRRVSEKNRCRLTWLLSSSDEIVAAMHKRKIPGSRTALHRFLERHGIHAQKKSCTLANRSGRTSRAPAGAGYASKGA